MVRITFTQRNKFTQSLIHTQTHTRKAGNNLHTHTCSNRHSPRSEGLCSVWRTCSTLKWLIKERLEGMSDEGQTHTNQRLLLWMCNNIFLSVSVNTPRTFPLSRVRISQHLLDTLVQPLPLCERISASGRETGWVSASPLDLFISHGDNPPSAHLTWLTWLF